MINQQTPHTKILTPMMLVVGLGYLIDAFDLFLYNVLRVPSLREMGLEGDAVTKTGLYILNIQLVGMLLGSVLWGMMGDRLGRKKALLGSVLVYSVGSLGCAFVQDVWLYGLLRFLTGFGLAGEVGLGAVLVAESMSSRQRDVSLLVYAVFAYSGIALAGTVGNALPWRVCYAAGGVAGLLLLLGRMALFESGLFEKMAQRSIPRGSLKLLLKRPDLLKRWLCSVLIATAYYLIVNVLISFAPEFAKAMGVVEPVKASTALQICAIFAMVGCTAMVALGRWLKSRRLTFAVALLINGGIVALYLTQSAPSAARFYALCALIGLGNFYVLLTLLAVEQFGTNMRATLGNSSLSFGRATLVATTSAFLALRGGGIGVIEAGAVVAAVAFVISFVALLGLKETYQADMDFIEEA